MAKRLRETKDIEEGLRDMKEDAQPVIKVYDEPVTEQAEPYDGSSIAQRIESICLKAMAMRGSDIRDRVHDTVHPALIDLAMREIRRDSRHAEAIVTAMLDATFNIVSMEAFLHDPAMWQGFKADVWKDIALRLTAERTAQENPVIGIAENVQGELRRKL